MLKTLKRILFNFCMGYLFNLLTEEGIIEIKHVEVTKKKSKVFLSGRELPEGERRELIAGAKSIMQIDGFTKIHQAMRAEATDKLVNKSATIDDMVAGKIMLYTLDVEYRLLQRLANLSQ